MNFTNNKRKTKGRIASAKFNATANYQAKMSKYFSDLLEKTYDEVVTIKENLPARFKNYHRFCEDALKFLFNKSLAHPIEQNSDIQL